MTGTAAVRTNGHVWAQALQRVWRRTTAAPPLAPEAARRRRQRIVLGDIDPSRCVGIEVGPLNNPLVKKDDGEVSYVDFARTEVLRQKPYDPSIDPRDIVEVDFVWGERPLAEVVPAPVDYVAASHVIEHVPDLVGWLRDLHDVLRPGGMLCLAIPDRRFTFDHFRNESTIGEVVEAYLLEFRRPSIRQIFDHCHSGRVVDAAKAWVGRPDANAPRLVGDRYALPLAWDQARALVHTPRYIDTHCWVFTPESFLSLSRLLVQLDLMPYRLAHVEPTRVGEIEFYVRLQRADGVDERSRIASFDEGAARVHRSRSEALYRARIARAGRRG